MELTWIRTGQIESEGLESRFDNLHNYLYLGEAIYDEEVKDGR